MSRNFIFAMFVPSMGLATPVLQVDAVVDISSQLTGAFPDHFK
jgi:hypothetical protein